MSAFLFWGVLLLLCSSHWFEVCRIQMENSPLYRGVPVIYLTFAVIRGVDKIIETPVSTMQ